VAKNGKSESLALAIASGSTIKDAAALVGCSERSAYRHSATPKFRQRVNELRSEITCQAVGRLTQAASQAADTLVSLLDASQEPNVRLNASKAILANLGPMAELGELRARVDALEKAKAVG
jgi:hypothetical protein